MSFLRNILNDQSRVRATVTVRATGQRQRPADRVRRFGNLSENQNPAHFENPPQHEIESPVDQFTDQENEYQFENLPEHEIEHQFENQPDENIENVDPNLPLNPHPELGRLFLKGN